MNSTSASLLLRLKSINDNEAWGRFVELYTPLIFYWARKSGLNQQDAADLSQEVLTLLVNKIPEFHYNSGKSFRSWLRTVTLNKHREQLRRKTLRYDAATQSALINFADSSESQQFWEKDYQVQLIHRAIELMRPDFESKTWDACREFMTSEKPANQIAQETGVSVWTIYSAKSRMLKRLRQELDGLLD